MFLQIIQPSGVQVKWFKNKLHQQQVEEKEKEKESMWNLGLKEEKNLELYGTLLAELWFTNDFWKLWRNISADKRQHTWREA